MNLLIALLSTRRYLTKSELRDIVEGYRGSSDTAFERQFERDKEELRGLGIEIETGSNDAYFDDEEGYRVNRSDFELPEVSFTPAELAALALAGQVWQDTVAADHTAQAFEALRAGGAAPDLDLVPSVTPRLDVREPDFDVVYDAVLRRRELRFGYGGAQRRLRPWIMLQRRGRWYVFGFDPDRDAERFFKLSRFTAPATATGKAGAFTVPVDASERAGRLVPSAGSVAVVALRAGAAHGFQHAEAIGWDEPLPDGFTAHRVQAVHDDAVVDEVVALGPDAVLLEPSGLRARVISRLQDVARLPEGAR